MILFRSITAFLVIVLGRMVSASAASFDCSRASSTQEKLICSDQILGVLDDQLEQIYKERLTHSKVRDAEKQKQIHWLVNVRGKCLSGLTNGESVIMLYQFRRRHLPAA